MQTTRPVHHSYNYRRLPWRGSQKPSSYHFVGCSSPEWTNDSDIRQRVIRPTDPKERDQILLRLAQAERALRIQTDARREYQVHNHAAALKRNEIGLRYLDMGDFPKAFRNFADAIGIDPGMALAHNNLGLLYLELGDLDEAKRHLDAALDLEPDLDIAYSNRALTFMEMGQYELAWQDLIKALELDPGDPLHHNNLGILLLEREVPDLARNCFSRAIELDGDNPMAWSNRGLAHRELNLLEEANHDFQEAIRREEAQLQEILASP